MKPIVLRSVEKLGDTIQRYCVCKRYGLKLLTRKRWEPLFDPVVLSKKSTDERLVDVGFDKIPNSLNLVLHNCPLRNISFHHRDLLVAYLNLGCPPCPSYPLHIKPRKANVFTVFINRYASTKDKSFSQDEYEQIKIILGSYPVNVVENSMKITLIDMVSYIAGSSLVISCDTSVLHIADAYGVDAIGVYKTHDPKFFGIYNNRKQCLWVKNDPFLDTLELMMHDKLKNVPSPQK